MRLLHLPLCAFSIYRHSTSKSFSGDYFGDDNDDDNDDDIIFMKALTPSPRCSEARDCLGFDMNLKKKISVYFFFMKRGKFIQFMNVMCIITFWCLLYRLLYGQGFDQACHPFFQCHSDTTTNNKGSRVKFSHNQ